MSGKRNLRALLFAGVSTVALAVATPEVRAADMAVPKAVLKAPPAIPALPVVTIWLEGGGFWTGGGDTNAIFHNDDYYDSAPEVNHMKPRVGWEVAFGADYRIAASPWHVSFDWRYGQAKANDKNFHTTVSTDGYAVNRFQEHESHMVADFMIGRDFNLGIGQSQIKLGVRVADLRATQKATGAIATSSSTLGSAFTDEWRSRFLGVGPRLAIDGTVPLGGPWAVDYMGGIAVLFGDRKLDRNYNCFGSDSRASCPAEGMFQRTQSFSDNGSVFNVDGSIALSYWFTPRAKLSGGFRVDSYSDALKVLSPNWNDQSVITVNTNRVYYGPFGRLTGTF